MERKLSQAHTAADAARDAAQRETVRAEALAAEKRLLVASEERAAAQVSRRSLTVAIALSEVSQGDQRRMVSSDLQS